MSQIKKTSTELDWVFVGSEPLLTAGLIALKFQLTNPYFIQASLGDAKWKSPSTGEYMPCSLALAQIENPNSLPVKASARGVTIYWNAAADLRIMQAFPAVTMVFSFWDRPNQMGAKTAIQEVTVPVDFTLSALGRAVKTVRPVVHDPYFTFQFINPTTIRPARMHFRLEVAPTEDFTGSGLKVFETSIDRTGWAADGVQFPEEGIDGLNQSRIGLTHAELTGLTIGDWYYRVTPIVNQFQSIIINPANGQVFLDTVIDVSGTISYWDN